MPRIELKLLEQPSSHESEDFEIKMAAANPGSTKKKSHNPIHVWNDFKKVGDDVEKCEYEYNIKGQEDSKKMWCQLSNVYSGTLQNFNITDRIDSMSFPQFLKLPEP